MKILLIAALSLSFPVYSQDRTSRDFERLFKEKQEAYIHTGVSRITVSEALFHPEEDQVQVENPYIRLKIKICKPTVGSKLQVAPWKEIKKYLKLKDISRLKPIVTKVRVQKEECQKVGALGARTINLPGAKIHLYNDLLLTHKKPIDINGRDTYLKVEVYEGRFPFRKKLGEDRFLTRNLMRELLLNSPSLDLAVDVQEDLSLALNLEMRARGTEEQDIQNGAKSFSNPLLLIDVLSKDEELRHLLYADSGVHEGYTIKEHTLRVLDLLKGQYSCHATQELEDSVLQNLGAPLDYFFQMTMSLHDIGKPLAYAAGEARRQHEYTAPIMEEHLSRAGLSQEAVATALTLMDNDAIGDYLKGTIRLEQAIGEIRSLAEETPFTPGEYFQLQTLFYTVDAGSYPYLFELVFKEREEDRCMVPKSSKFAKLRAEFFHWEPDKDIPTSNR